MKTYITMLRGINVGGRKKIRMEELRELYESLGYENVQSYIQSGNVIFESKPFPEKKLANEIESEIKKKYGFEVAVIVRTAEEMRMVCDGNPFLKVEKADISKLHVVFLSGKPKEIPHDIIEMARSTGEEIKFTDREVYLYLPHGYGRSKLNNNFFEKISGIPATTRNMKTVRKLAEMAG